MRGRDRALLPLSYAGALCCQEPVVAMTTRVPARCVSEGHEAGRVRPGAAAMRQRRSVGARWRGSMRSRPTRWASLAGGTHSPAMQVRRLFARTQRALRALAPVTGVGVRGWGEVTGTDFVRMCVCEDGETVADAKRRPAGRGFAKTVPSSERRHRSLRQGVPESRENALHPQRMRAADSDVPWCLRRLGGHIPEGDTGP